MAIVVVLPAPLPPQQRDRRPARDHEVEAVHGEHVAVALGGSAHGDGGGRHRITPRRQSRKAIQGTARIGWRRCQGVSRGRTPECRSIFQAR